MAEEIKPLVRKMPPRPLRFRLPTGDMIEITRVAVAYREKGRREWMRLPHGAAMIEIAQHLADASRRPRIKRGGI